MSREDIRNQIKAYEEKIAKIEEEFSKKKIYTKKKLTQDIVLNLKKRYLNLELE